MSKLGIVVAGFLSLSMAVVAVYVWLSLGDVAMSAGGYIAMISGGLATVALGVALMALVFYSNRHGFDDQIGTPLVVKDNARHPNAPHPNDGTPTV